MRRLHGRYTEKCGPVRATKKVGLKRKEKQKERMIGKMLYELGYDIANMMVVVVIRPFTTRNRKTCL